MTNGLASGEARRSMAYPEVSNAEAPEVSNAECQSLASALDTSGYAVLRQAFDPAQAAAALAALSQPGGLLVRDAVWMRNSERIAQVLELDDIFGEILSLLPAEVEASLTDVLGAEWLLGSFHALVLHPEPALNASEHDRIIASHLHSDYPYGHATPFHGGSATSRAPQWPPTMQLLWMLTEFTEENGATLVLPGSHADAAIPQRGRADDSARFRNGAVAVTGRAGDLLVYSGQLWHSVGLNFGAAPRAALIGQVLPLHMARAAAISTQSRIGLARCFPSTWRPWRRTRGRCRCACSDASPPRRAATSASAGSTSSRASSGSRRCRAALWARCASSPTHWSRATRRRTTRASSGSRWSC